jgi:uncharacterized protein (TIGR03067 family)
MRMKYTWYVVALAVLPAAVSLGLGADREAKSALMGVYTIISGQENGKPVSPERLKADRITITADSITGLNKAHKDFFACTYTLDTTTKPWTITMMGTSPRKETVVGIVETDGDLLKICYALPGADKPTSFATTRDRQQCFILKRVKDLKSR